MLVAGVLKSTFKLRSKLIFKILFFLQMVQTKCQVICPHSKQEAINVSHQVEVGTFTSRHQPQFIHPPPKASQQAKQLYPASPVEMSQHQSKARVLSRLGEVGKDGGGFLCVEGRGSLGKSLQIHWDHGNHWQQEKQQGHF